ncbi:hypothetical protein LZ30DRAFT_306245 [Colletotrichum cereale]|nr:hypothetical protein LZ30DRAFT_306245 [Colletotrichum cereale]
MCARAAVASPPERSRRQAKAQAYDIHRWSCTARSKLPKQQQQQQPPSAVLRPWRRCWLHMANRPALATLEPSRIPLARPRRQDPNIVAAVSCHELMWRWWDAGRGCLRCPRFAPSDSICTHPCGGFLFVANWLPGDKREGVLEWGDGESLAWLLRQTRWSVR